MRNSRKSALGIARHKPSISRYDSNVVPDSSQPADPMAHFAVGFLPRATRGRCAGFRPRDRRNAAPDVADEPRRVRAERYLRLRFRFAQRAATKDLGYCGGGIRSAAGVEGLPGDDSINCWRALATRNGYNVAATVGLLFVAWAYSVPPVRLKERPPLDSLSNGLGFFLLPFVMGYSLGADPLTMPLKYYLLALSVCGIHALATAADYEADQAAGHCTLAVACGRRAAAAFAFVAFAVALVAGDYQGVAVRVYLAVGVAATLMATLVPKDGAINAACVTIFVGFLIAAVCHVVGW